MKTAYLNLSKKEIKERIEKSLSLLNPCILCPRECKVNRLANEKGFCGIGRNAIISSYGPHFGEESVLVGKKGSGTVFISGCNLKCVFCQNYTISHLIEGEEVSSEEFSKIMLYIQKIGCHNLNIVTPTHIVPQFLEALYIAIDNGFSLPIVYNTGGYDKVETINLLDGIVDIYMPDFKFSSNEVAKKFTSAEDYPYVAKMAIKEMYRQVGDLIIENGIATHGLLVRHLVLPNGQAGTEDVVKFLAELSKNTYVNIMDQYYPCWKAFDYISINRRIYSYEFNESIRMAKKYGLYRLDKEESTWIRWLR